MTTYQQWLQRQEDKLRKEDTKTHKVGHHNCPTCGTRLYTSECSNCLDNYQF